MKVNASIKINNKIPILNKIKISNSLNFKTNTLIKIPHVKIKANVFTPEIHTSISNEEIDQIMNL